MRNKQAGIWFLVVLWAAFFIVFSGCGKKGPPLPPGINSQKLEAPFDLQYRPVESGIVLSWHHRIDTKTAGVPPEGFDIFMAKKTVEACAGCPFEFKRQGSVVMPATEAYIKIEKGYNYYFRVQATGDDNRTSEYSKTIQFEYK